MNIGAAAEATGVPPKSIRYYESFGLIPTATRAENGYRHYTGFDIETLKFIQRTRHLGFSVKDVGGLWRYGTTKIGPAPASRLWRSTIFPTLNNGFKNWTPSARLSLT